MNFCKNCGEVLYDGTKFCLNCGCPNLDNYRNTDYSNSSYKCKDYFSYKETYNTYHEIKEADIVKEVEETKRKKIDSVPEIIAMLIVLMVIVNFCLNHYDFKKNESEREKRAAVSKEQGMINAGKDEDYIGEDYKAVVSELKAIGFENITTIDSKDSGVKFWTNKEVKSISIDGMSDFDELDYFEKDVKVIITYH